MKQFTSILLGIVMFCFSCQNNSTRESTFQPERKTKIEDTIQLCKLIEDTIVHTIKIKEIYFPNEKLYQYLVFNYNSIKKENLIYVNFTRLKQKIDTIEQKTKYSRIKLGESYMYVINVEDLEWIRECYIDSIINEKYYWLTVFSADTAKCKVYPHLNMQ